MCNLSYGNTERRLDRESKPARLVDGDTAQAAESGGAPRSEAREKSSDERPYKLRTPNYS